MRIKACFGLNNVSVFSQYSVIFERLLKQRYLKVGSYKLQDNNVL